MGWRMPFSEDFGCLKLFGQGINIFWDLDQTLIDNDKKKDGIEGLLDFFTKIGINNFVTTRVSSEHDARMVLGDNSLLKYFGRIFGGDECSFYPCGMPSLDGKVYTHAKSELGISDYDFENRSIVIGNDAYDKPRRGDGPLFLYDEEGMSHPSNYLSEVINALMLMGNGSLKTGFEMLHRNGYESDFYVSLFPSVTFKTGYSYDGDMFEELKSDCINISPYEIHENSLGVSTIYDFRGRDKSTMEFLSEKFVGRLSNVHTRGINRGLERGILKMVSGF